MELYALSVEEIEIHLFTLAAAVVAESESADWRTLADEVLI